MKTVTVEKFLTFKPCWLDEEGGEERLREIGSRKKEWTAMDVLELEEVSAHDRLRAVLREGFLDKNIIVEFACLCAERALAIAGVTDKRCWNAVNVRRSWMRGEAFNDDIDGACAVVCTAARDEEQDAANAAMQDAVRDAEWVSARASKRALGLAAACAIVRDSTLNGVSDAAWAAAWYEAWAVDSMNAGKAYKNERAWQIETLKRLIVEDEKEETN